MQPVYTTWPYKVCYTWTILKEWVLKERLIFLSLFLSYDLHKQYSDTWYGCTYRSYCHDIIGTWKPRWFPIIRTVPWVWPCPLLLKAHCILIKCNWKRKIQNYYTSEWKLNTSPGQLKKYSTLIDFCNCCVICCYFKFLTWLPYSDKFFAKLNPRQI